MDKNYNERYNRQLNLPGFGPEAQAKLTAAKVLVIGAGGLGVPALQYLAGMGIGTLGIVDGDHISLSNLHRQVLYFEQEIGQLKAVIAQQKLSLLNASIQINCYPINLDPQNALELIEQYDLVVDATDNFSARYLINDASVLLKKPFVYGSVHQYEGHVSVFNLGDGPTYRCLYPNMPAPSEIPDCNTGGVLGVAPSLIGCKQALEVVKVVTGIGKNLSGYLQIFDFLNDEQYKIKLRVNPENKQLKALQEQYESASCVVNSSMITPLELQDLFDDAANFLLIDVRTVAEFEAGHLPNAINIPLDVLPETPVAHDAAMPVIVYCQKGSRSMKAAGIIRERHPGMRLLELTGGIDNWLKIIK